MPKTIKVKLTQADLKKQTGYSDSRGCILYQALHLRFPKKNICVGGVSVDIGTQKYELKRGNNYKVEQASLGLSELPVTITLTPRKEQ